MKRGYNTRKRGFKKRVGYRTPSRFRRRLKFKLSKLRIDRNQLDNKQ